MVTQEELEKMSPEEIAELQKQNCIFCKIVKGEIPSSKILDNELTLSILDINPARPGHALVMPKEHYPILPLVPPETFKKIFTDAKVIASAVKKKTLAGSVAVFIANGALAGQQSPHFLFHVIPDQKFNLAKNDAVVAGNNALADALKNNLNIMMNNHLKREGKLPQASSSPQPQASPQDMEKKREQIAKIIEENKDVRDLLRVDVEKFRETINQHDQLKALFEGVDLEALSQHLKSMPEPAETPSQSQEQVQQDTQETETSTIEQPPEQTPEESQEEHLPEPSSQVAAYATSPPKIFLGGDPVAQKQQVLKYFEEKPQAKDLLIKDPQTFKELLQKRADVQPIFADINIDELAKSLKEGDDA